MPDDYPMFPQILGSSKAWADDMTVDVAVNGAPRVRAFFPAKRLMFKLIHVLTSDDLDTLESFYDANRVLEFNMQWMTPQGPTYLCVFASVPKIDNGNPYHRIEVNLRKVG